MGFLSDLGNVIDAAAGAYGLFQGRDAEDDIPGLGDANKYLKASVNPDDPLFKNLAAQWTSQNRRATSDAIRSIMSQNRRAQARGDPGFGINPERRDEANTKAIIDAHIKANESSRLYASQMLQGAAGQGANVVRATAPYYSGYANAEFGAPFQAIDAFTEMLRGFEPEPGTTGNPIEQPETADPWGKAYGGYNPNVNTQMPWGAPDNVYGYR